MKDKSELIDSILEDYGIVVNLNEGWSPQTIVSLKATLQKAFREVEIEGGKKELGNLLADFTIERAKARLEELNDQQAELTKIKEDGNE